MPPMIEVLPEGFLLSVENISYSLTWIGELLKVEGGGICYYLKETTEGLAQIDCTTLTEVLVMEN